MISTAADKSATAFLAQLERAHKAPPAARPSGSMRITRAERIQAKYDSAQTTDSNSRHWNNADNLSADSAMGTGTRQTIRSRARYECLENNSVGNHIVRTLANDLVGRGPRLQVQTEDSELNKAIELPFNRWARHIHLAKKLRTMRQAKAVDGESFAMFHTNRRLSGVQLDLRVIEADQIASPLFSFLTAPNAVDGIEFDSDGNPEWYHLLKAHPGSTLIGGNPSDFERIDFADMLHAFRQDRAGQHRGVSEVQAALPLFAMIRDFSLSTLAASITASKHAAVVETDGTANDDNLSWDPRIEPFTVVDIDRDMMTTLPFGWKMHQFKPEQPATTFEMFLHAIVNQIACVVDMPLNIALCNSSGFNYASGRLDHQTYFKSMQVERCYFEIEILDRILSRWFDEAIFIAGLIPAGLGPLEEIPHTWTWDGREHVDPAKEASGQSTRLTSGTSHRAREYASIGLDVDEEDAKAAASYDKTIEEYRAGLYEKHFGTTAASEVAVAAQVRAAVEDGLEELMV